MDIFVQETTVSVVEIPLPFHMMNGSLRDMFFLQDQLKILCAALSHSMHSKNKLNNFLCLRVTCRDAVNPVYYQIPRRIVLLLGHPRQEVRDSARHIKDSGFLLQLLLCGGQPACNGFLRMVSCTGIPLGTTTAYWESRQRHKLKTGWEWTWIDDRCQRQLQL